ncbi:MAG: hypothetical protein PVG56_11710 [Anaerolineae bacterium]
MIAIEGDVTQRQLIRKLGLRNGLLIGLALALGALAPRAITLCRAHVEGMYPALLLGLLALLLLGGVAGWLSTWRSSALWGALLWLLASAAMTWTLGHLPYEGQSLAAWLAERSFWGLPVYAFSDAAQARLLMAGFFIVLCLTILGLLQNYRLEGIASETDTDGGMTGRVWFLLLLPLPFVIGVGLAADNIVGSSERAAQQLVHEAIRTGRTYQGDLFELSLKRGVNYNAIAGVRDQMSENYALSTAEVTLSAASSVVIVAHFDNGAWINCQVAADQLFHCYDASLHYLQGFPALLVSGETPADCRQCAIKVDEPLRDWLLARSQQWEDTPHVTRLAQRGSYVLMQAQSPQSGYGIACLFHGISPVTLSQCWEIETQD